MPHTLALIPADTRIVDKDGAINLYFRQLWEALRNGFQQTPTVALVQKRDQAAALGSTSAYVTRVAGLYRVSYYLRKVIADGVSSSLTFAWGWTESGVALTESAAALTTDTVLAEQSGSKVVYSDANANLDVSVAYASNTPGQMHWRGDVVVEQLA